MVESIYAFKRIEDLETWSMKHYIIIKWKPEVKASEHFNQGIFDLFQGSLKIVGVHDVTFHRSVIDLPNRYDLMICMEMDREALARFDDSDIHARWKAGYGGYVEAKTIFDCD